MGRDGVEGTPVIRVLIADDQAMVRSGLALLLRAESDVEIVGQARDGGEAVRLARELQPDVVLMDVRMPGLDGIEATRMVTGTDVQDPPAVVVLTTFGAQDYVDRALRAGAVGFVLKDSNPERLVEAVRAAADGDGLLDPAVTRSLIERYAGGRGPTPSGAATTAELTEREHEVFDELVRGGTNAEIADRLHVEASTVKTHVAAVLRKLGVRDRVEAVIYAYEHGLVTAPPPDGGDGDRPAG
jgi:DNA-binding NarL/FixJ family response regulator